MGDDKAQIDALKKEIEDLKKQVSDQRAGLGGDSESAFGDSSEDMRTLSQPPSARRTLKGHFGKVYAMHWAGKVGGVEGNEVRLSSRAVFLSMFYIGRLSFLFLFLSRPCSLFPFLRKKQNRCVSASQDGKLIIWNACKS